MTYFRLFITLLISIVATSVAGASCSFGGDDNGSGSSVTTVNPNAPTGFDIRFASNSYNYTLYRGNPSLWGNLQPGGFLEYTVFAPVAGAYALQAYYSTPAQGAGASLMVNGSQQSALNLASTGSWGNMVLSSPATVNLPSGQSVLRIAVQNTFQPFNLAGLLATPIATSALSPGVTNVNQTGQTTFNLASASNASNYVYYPSSPGTWGNLQPGGFVEFAVAANSGNYALQLGYSTTVGGGASITVNGSQQQGTSFPSTGSWNSYQMSSPVTLTIPSGNSVIRIAAQKPFAPFNLQQMKLAPVAQPAPGGNPLANTGFYVNPYSEAAQNVNNSCGWLNPNNPNLISKIANQPQGVWFGDWNANIQGDVSVVVNSASSQGKAPILIAYDIPIRDCNGYSGGGSRSADEYRSWIRRFASGIGGAKAVVILEPDALLQLYTPGCLNGGQQQERLSLLSYAVSTLGQTAPNASVYIDAGRAGQWEIAPWDMAQRLRSSGVSNAAGFALNVSNYISTDVTTTYGQQISSLAGNPHFVIDTSRNGLGADGDLNWCNPPGRGLGAPPQGFSSGLTDAYLWVQNPGSSDGSCNGQPSAGQFSVYLACTLANNAIF